MRRARRILLALVILVILIAVGPRAGFDAAPVDITLPDDLDTYLRDRERDVPPAVAKTIVWRDPQSKRRTKLALVYLHGFSATRIEINPACALLAQMLDANLYFTRLDGHGLGSEALGAASATQWYRDTAEAVAIGRRLGERVVVIGTSTGATLASLYLAHEKTAELQACILLSPNFRESDPMARILRWPWAPLVAPIFIPEHSFEPANEEMARWWTTRYPSPVLFEMASIVEAAVASDFDAIGAPVLCLVDDADRVVRADFTRTLLAGTNVVVEPFVTDDPNRHVLAGNVLSPRTTLPLVERLARFIRESG
ncbi:MAG: alpha/beta fold hydrolase [Planctomycetota bacterium]